MNRSFLYQFMVASLLGGVLHVSASAQIEARMHIGGSAYTFRGEDGLDVTPVFRLTGGGGIAYTLGNGFSVRPELNYVAQGGKMDGLVGTVPVEATFFLTYLEVPVFLAWRMPTRSGITPEFAVGPAIGISIDSRWEFDPGRGAVGEEKLDRVPSRAIVGAADVIFPFRGERLSVGIRAWYAVKDAGLEEAVPGRESLRSTGVTLLTGIIF